MSTLEKKKRRGLSMKLSEFHKSKEAWINKPRKSWNIVTFVSHFCIKYEKLYNVSYIFSSWRGNPALTKEGRDFSMILKVFTDQQDLSKIEAKTKLYNYINWSFDFKGKRNCNINSTGLLRHNAFMNEFEKAYSKYVNKKKNDLGMSGLIAWCKGNNGTILENYELKSDRDLEFIREMVIQYKLESGPEKDLIDMAKEMGIL